MDEGGEIVDAPGRKPSEEWKAGDSAFKMSFYLNDDTLRSTWQEKLLMQGVQERTFFFCKDDLKWLQKLDIDTLDYCYQMEALALIRAQAAGILNSSQARNKRYAFPCFFMSEKDS